MIVKMSSVEPFETLETFSTIHDACDAINRSATMMYKAIRDGNKLVGFYWDKVDEKPINYVCKKCGIEKPFNLEHFTSKQTNRFGISLVCRLCTKKLYGYKTKMEK